MARKLITLSTMLKQVWAFTTIVGERTRNSLTRGIVQQQIWQICNVFRIDMRLHYRLEEEVIFFCGMDELLEQRDENDQTFNEVT